MFFLSLHTSRHIGLFFDILWDTYLKSRVSLEETLIGDAEY